jgi:hypothetical protein
LDPSTTLVDARSTTGETTQVVKLRPADISMPDHFEVIDDRSVNWEGALNADTEAQFANRERLPKTPTTAGNHNAFEHLEAFALALTNLDVNADGIAWTKRRNVASEARGFNEVNAVHSRSPTVGVGGAPW